MKIFINLLLSNKKRELNSSLFLYPYFYWLTPYTLFVNSIL